METGEMQNFLEDNIIILTKETLDIFLSQTNTGDLIGLYTFYYYTSKWQKTNQIKSTTSYTAKGLGWSESRVRITKKQLKDLGLIQDVFTHNKNGEFGGAYIRINYKISGKIEKLILENETQPLLQNQEAGNHSPDFTTLGETPPSVKMESNAYSNSNINAYSNSNNKTKIINNFSGDKPLSKNSSTSNKISNNIFSGKKKFIKSANLEENVINNLNPPAPLKKEPLKKESKNDVICNNLKLHSRNFIKNTKVIEMIDKWLDSLNHNKRLVSKEELEENLKALLKIGAGGQYDAVKNAIACGHRTLVYSIEKFQKNRNILNLDNDVIIDPEEESKKIKDRLNSTLTQEDYENVKKDENGNFVF